MLTHWTRVEIVCDVLWFLWLCLVPPHAKCRVCEDMQVARCLCNFPPALLRKRQARRNNNEQVLLLKSNSARIPEVLDVTWRPLLLCGRGSGLTDWSSGSVTVHSSPGLREQVGGVLGMLWRIRFLRDVLFFVNCSESGVCVSVVCACVCVCRCICVSCGSSGAMLSSFGGSTPQTLEFQDLYEPLKIQPLC